MSVYIRLFLFVSITFLSVSHAQANSPKTVTDLDVVTERLCSYRDSILYGAQFKSTPADLMFSCLISEHSYLVNDADSMVDAAAYLGIYKDPSLGFAQIKLSTARPLAKTIFNRELSDEEIILDLLTPRRASVYMAQLINNILNDYAQFGFYLYLRPDLICSSYLVGNSYAKARAHSVNGTQPGSNYYGRFAMKNWQLAQDIASGQVCK